MARRRKKHDSRILVGFAVAVGGIWIVVQFLKQLSQSGSELLFIIFLIAAYFVIRHRLQTNARSALFQKVQNKIEQHIDPLVRRRAQLVQTDPYGKPRMEKWTQEVESFLTGHIEPLLTSKERVMLGRERAAVVSFIETRVVSETQNRPAFQEFSDGMTPTEFERFCAEQLRSAGWNARVTQQTRDQGADVVAENDGKRVVIQCKLYDQPVGNKSVQEVVAAKDYEQADYAIVVTNNRYTRAAEQLASTNEVLLLHYSDLRNLHNLLAGKNFTVS